MGKRVVLAVSGIQPEMAEQWFRQLKLQGCDFLTDFDVTYGKNLLFSCLESRDDIQVIILSEYQGRERMSPEDIEQIESISKSNGMVIIPVVNEQERGNSYLAQLFSLGIYTAVYEADSAPENLSNLILHGRSRAETKEYYGISTQQIIDETPPVQEEVPRQDKSEKKRNSGRKKKKEVTEDNIQPKPLEEYAVAATGVGVGSTFQCILMASALASLSGNERVAIVELDNTERNMQVLCTQLPEYNSRMRNNFSLGKVSYFFNVPFEEFHLNEARNYTTVFYDAGCCDDQTIQYLQQRVNRFLVVSDGNEWHRGELVEFVQAMNNIDRNRAFTYLFPTISGTLMEGIDQILSGYERYAVPCEENPFSPSRKSIELFDFIFNHKGKEPDYPKGENLESRCSSKTKRKKSVSNIFGFATAFLGVALVASIVIGVVRYHSLNKRATDLITQANQIITELNGRVSKNAEDVQAMERKVLQLTVDAYPGDELTPDMVKEVIITSSEPKTSFISSTDVEDKVFCLYVAAGTNIRDYMLCGQIKEEPPIVTIGGSQ